MLGSMRRDRNLIRLAMITALLWALPVPSPQAGQGEAIAVHKRARVEREGAWVQRETAENWRPEETAIIVCDVWDAHHSLNAVRRIQEMAPRMNDLLEAARARGVLIIHAPSGCMEPYRNHVGRRR